MKKTTSLIMILLATLCSNICFAAGGSNNINLGMTGSMYGILALIIFILAYVLVIGEEFTHMRKSKPVMMAAGFIWVLIAIAAQSTPYSKQIDDLIKYNILHYAELALFLLVAMTYVNALEERQVFNSLRCFLVNKGLSYRQLFWATGILAFFISPIADNLTTALLMCAVIMACGQGNKKFISISCVSIVIAANAGGAFSPFGDITTLMVWQSYKVNFFDFFKIFVPSVVNFLVPAAFMHFAIPNEQPPKISENISMKYGAKTILGLFLLTIATAVTLKNVFHFPPVFGMMFGLSYLQIYGYFIKRRDMRLNKEQNTNNEVFDVFKKIANAEWDTLLFFYGVIMCVGGLSVFGYLAIASETMYGTWGQGLPAIHAQTPANIMVGILSAIVDNIPVMFAVLTMDPTMSLGQWLLVTLTAGCGGSLLSVGSAAGVALMGQARGNYTFFSHLKWIWAIALGYFASIAVHIWINAYTFHMASNVIH